ncbi:YeeE/YedE thiosulfate transporter family protein, partial [Anaerospora hongkongensis]
MSETQTIIRKRPQITTKKKSQLGYTGAALLVVIAVAIHLSQSKTLLSIIWFLGIGLGIVLQKSRFCFTASLRDPILTGSTSLTRATMIAFAVASLGFAALQFTTL